MSGASVGIIGAGMAGLTCATELARSGVEVTVFDKGRGPGGRMATRRAEVNGETLYFDHGAQYFTARDSAFVATVGKWLVRGAVGGWPAGGGEAYVGSPGMNGPLKLMASKLDVKWAARIEALCKTDDGRWTVTGAEAERTFDMIVSAIPAEQAAVLLDGPAKDFAALASQSKSRPCWAAMAAFSGPLEGTPDAIRSRDGKIAWAARNSSKPGRDAPETWVIHASPEFSTEILELPKEEAAEVLLAAFFEQADIKPVPASHLAAHRWLYAMAEPRADLEKYGGFLWDDLAKIGACGDWLTEPRVEGAFLSGRNLAQAILGSLSSGSRPI